MKPSAYTTLHKAQRALLVQVILGRGRLEEWADSLAELERLADTAGVKVVGAVTQRRERPAAGFLIGEGKLADVQLACRQGRADLVVFDNELSPSQVNNLDLALGVKVIDRTELILHIFARRARSAESQIQVELAQLQYLLSRIPVSQAQPRFTGGIGVRGPGESPLQLRNVPMRRRIRELKGKLDDIVRRRRQTRTQWEWPLVCIVGYTNAGKSTLLNALARGDAYVDDRLFATLDTKTRLVHLREGSKALLTDTVGFIRRLPHTLVASFRSTLEVCAEADLLLVVAESDHPRVQDHLAVVRETLTEIGADRVPALLVLNKADTPAGQAAIPALLQAHPAAIPISALRRDGLARLKKEMADAIPDRHAHREPGGCV
jgi:GTP-binding protein HflX